jgi:diguanylate cyclase (GGDEF)-like protein
MLVRVVSRARDTIAFWDALPTEGSFAAVPINHAGEEIGFFVLTRPPEDPLSEIQGRYLEALADQAALAIHNAQLVRRLEELSTHDGLTGLANRRLFERRLARATARADRFAHSTCVLALDIDHFKNFNDRCGHPAGDAALKAVAAVLVESLREVDTAARVGGEEFWVLLPQTDAAGAAEVAEKLRRRIASLDVEGANGQPLGHLSVSIGVAEREPHEGSHPLLSRADEALYVAKRSGRDRVSVPAMPAAS